MSYTYVGDPELYDDLDTAADIEAPEGANAALIQAVDQDVHLNLSGGDSTTDSLGLTTLDGIREVYVGFGGAFSVIEADAGAALRVQWIRTGRRHRDQ